MPPLKHTFKELTFRINFMRILLIWLLLLINWNLNAQSSRIDSLTRLAAEPAHDTVRAARYLELAKAYFFTDPEPTDSLLAISESFFIPHDHFAGLSDVYNLRANYRYLSGDLAGAGQALNTASEYANQAGDTLHAIGIRMNLTIVQSDLGDTDGALTNFQRSLDYLERHSDTLLLGLHYLQRGRLRQNFSQGLLALRDYRRAYTLFADGPTDRRAEVAEQLGSLMRQEERFDEAARYLHEAEAGYARANQQQHRAQNLTLLGTTYDHLGQPERADSFFRAAIALSTQLEQPYNVAHARLLRAEAYYERGQLQQALSAVAEVIPTLSPDGEAVNLAAAYQLRGDIRRILRDPTAAAADFNRALALVRPLGRASSVKELLALRAAAHESAGRYRQAAADAREHRQLSDSVFSLERARALDELQVIHETEIKEKTIALQRAEARGLRQELRAEAVRQRSLLTGAVLLLAVIGLSFYVYRLRSREAARRQTENIRLRERELAAHALEMKRKNEILRDVHQRVEQLSAADGSHRELLGHLRIEESLDQDWEAFGRYFAGVHGSFTERLDELTPKLSLNERRLAQLLRLGTSTAEIAELLRIQPESVRKAKYRLKTKLGLGAEDDLEQRLKQL